MITLSSTLRNNTHPTKAKRRLLLLTSLGLGGLAGFGQMVMDINQPVQAQSPSKQLTPVAAPWPTPVPWRPESLIIPTLQPLPVAYQAPPLVTQGVIPVNYSPPDGIDVAGGTVLHWAFNGSLAEDEWFDIKIKPYGSADSAFVDWTRQTEYQLAPWSGWTSGLYTWQIGIVKGYKEGEVKHFIADMERDSQPFLLKWQVSGGSHSGGSASAPGNLGGGGSGGS